MLNVTFIFLHYSYSICSLSFSRIKFGGRIFWSRSQKFQKRAPEETGIQQKNERKKRIKIDMESTDILMESADKR